VWQIETLHLLASRRWGRGVAHANDKIPSSFYSLIDQCSEPIQDLKDSGFFEKLVWPGLSKFQVIFAYLDLRHKVVG
jgi:hypothetical protein